MARGSCVRIADLLTHRGNTGVAGEGKEQQPAGLEDPPKATAAQRRPAAEVRRVDPAAGRDRHDHDGERERLVPTRTRVTTRFWSPRDS